MNKHEKPHTCLHSSMNLDYRNLDSALVSVGIKAMVKEDLSFKVSSIMAEVKEKYRYTITYIKGMVGEIKSHCTNIWGLG